MDLNRAGVPLMELVTDAHGRAAPRLNDVGLSAEEARTHTTYAGEIVMNKRKAFDVGRAPSVQQGPKDTLPPPNPDTFTRTTTGTGGAAANSTPGSGDSGGSGGGHDNNGGVSSVVSITMITNTANS